MKTCPKCNGKYFDMDTICSECNIELIDNKEYNQIISELQSMTREERERSKYNSRYRLAYKYYWQQDITNDNNSKISIPPQPKPQPEQNIPKCPTCQSTNVTKISTTKKAFGFAAVGVFSSNFGKTMECKNCGYKW